MNPFNNLHVVARSALALRDEAISSNQKIASSG